jgi:hypothetical protein
MNLRAKNHDKLVTLQDEIKLMQSHLQLVDGKNLLIKEELIDLTFLAANKSTDSTSMLLVQDSTTKSMSLLRPEAISQSDYSKRRNKMRNVARSELKPIKKLQESQAGREMLQTEGNETALIKGSMKIESV